MSGIAFNSAGGATAYPNFYYTKDGVRKVWTGENSDMPSWDDERFVKF